MDASGLHMDLHDANLWIAIMTIAFNPLFWNIVSYAFKFAVY